MKIPFLATQARASARAAIVLWLGVAALPAAPAIKSPSGTDLSGATAGVWSGGGGINGAPVANDIATWIESSAGSALTLTKSRTWSGIAVTGAASAIAIGGTGTLTLGAGGVSLAATGQDLTLATPLRLGADQRWDVASGRTLTVTTALGGTGALTLAGAGTVQWRAGAAHTGVTRVEAGVLELVPPVGSRTLGQPSVSGGEIVVASGAQLGATVVAQDYVWARALTLEAGAAIQVKSSFFRASHATLPTGSSVGGFSGHVAIGGLDLPTRPVLTFGSVQVPRLSVQPALIPANENTTTVFAQQTLRFDGTGSGAVLGSAALGSLTLSDSVQLPTYRHEYVLDVADSPDAATEVTIPYLQLQGNRAGLRVRKLGSGRVLVQRLELGVRRNATGDAIRGINSATLSGEAGKLSLDLGGSPLRLDYGDFVPNARTALLYLRGEIFFEQPIKEITVVGTRIPVSTGLGYPLISWEATVTPNLAGTTLSLPTGVVGTLAVVDKTLYLRVTASPAPPARQVRVLMLGNSYTFRGGALDKSASSQFDAFLNDDPTLSAVLVQYSAGANTQYLSEHMINARSSDLLYHQGPWDFVVLQDQSRAAGWAWMQRPADMGGDPNWQEQSIRTGWWNDHRDGMDTMSLRVRAVGAKLVYFQTWARGVGESYVLPLYHGEGATAAQWMQDATSAAYEYSGYLWTGMVAPVGEAWRRSLARSPDLLLHDADFHHSGPRGAYLAGATLYQTLTGTPAKQRAYSGTLPPGEAGTLKDNLASLEARYFLEVDPSVPAGQTVTASTAHPVGQPLGRFQAQVRTPPADRDVLDPNPRLVRYAIVSGNEAGRFALDADTGVLRASAALTPGATDLVIEVTDSNHWTAQGGLRVNVGAPTPFQSWMAEQGLGGGLPEDDSDGDGVGDWLEYAFGGRPTVADSALGGAGRPLLPQVGVDDRTRLRLSFVRRGDAVAAGLRYTVQFSRTLDRLSWQAAGSAGFAVTETVTPLGVGWEEVVVTLVDPAQAGAPALFGRVKVDAMH
jgi:hypothetical protein